MLEIQKNSEVMSKVDEIVKQNAKIVLKIEEQKEECNLIKEENVKIIIRDNIQKLYKIERDNYNLLKEILVNNNYKFLCDLVVYYSVYVNNETKEIILLHNEKTFIYFINKLKSKEVKKEKKFNLDEVLPFIFQNLLNEKDVKSAVIYNKNEKEVEYLKLIRDYIYN